MLCQSTSALAALALFVSPLALAAPSPIHLPGTAWRSECLGDGLGGAQQGEVAFTGKQVRLSIRSFADGACAKPSFSVNYLEDAALGSDTVSIVPVTLDLTLASLQVSDVSPAQAETFNALGFCGLRDWKAGESRDITARACAGAETVKAGDRSYDLVGLSYDDAGAQLHLGMRELGQDGGSPATRPTSLDLEHGYRMTQPEAR